MRPLTFTMQFRGISTPLSPGVLTARARAASASLRTWIDRDGVHGELESIPGDEALLECRLTFVDDEHFEEVGTISFGGGNALRFRSVGQGTLARSADPSLRQGASAWEVDGGAGVFAGATGRIVSNLLVSETGELTDHQLGVIFLDGESGEA